MFQIRRHDPERRALGTTFSIYSRLFNTPFNIHPRLFNTPFNIHPRLCCVHLAARPPVLPDRSRRTQNRHIQRLCSSRRKDHPLRMGKPKQRSQSPSRLHDRSVRAKIALRVSAGRIAQGPQRLHHCLRDAGRLLQRGRCGIEINGVLLDSRRSIEINWMAVHILTTLPAPAIVCAITYMFVMPPTSSLSLRP